MYNIFAFFPSVRFEALGIRFILENITLRVHIPVPFVMRMHSRGLLVFGRSRMCPASRGRIFRIVARFPSSDASVPHLIVPGGAADRELSTERKSCACWRMRGPFSFQTLNRFLPTATFTFVDTHTNCNPSHTSHLNVFLPFR